MRLIDADELKRLIKSGDDLIFDASTERELIYMIDYQPAVNRWIPCSDRLPEIDEDVIVFYRYLPDTPIQIAHRKEGYFWEYCDGENTLLAHGITHWMPLPEPPGGEDDDER